MEFSEIKELNFLISQISKKTNNYFEKRFSLFNALNRQIQNENFNPCISSFFKNLDDNEENNKEYIGVSQVNNSFDSLTNSVLQEPDSQKQSENISNNLITKV